MARARDAELVDRMGVLCNMEEHCLGCFSHVVKEAAEKIIAVCPAGGGVVRPLEELEGPEFQKGIGLYRAMMDAAVKFMGCQRAAGDALCVKQEEDLRRKPDGAGRGV